MTGSSWTPGHRRVPGGLNPQGFHKRITAVLTMGALVLRQYVAPRDEVAEIMELANRSWLTEEGDSTLLSVKYGPNRGILLNLSHLTEQELDAFASFVSESVERARPSVQRRDAIAQEAEGNGDYSYARSNRADPKLVGEPRPLK